MTHVLEGHAALTLRSRLRCILIKKEEELQNVSNLLGKEEREKIEGREEREEREERERQERNELFKKYPRPHPPPPQYAWVMLQQDEDL